MYCLFFVCCFGVLFWGEKRNGKRHSLSVLFVERSRFWLGLVGGLLVGWPVMCVWGIEVVVCVCVCVEQDGRGLGGELGLAAVFPSVSISLFGCVRLWTETQKHKCTQIQTDSKTRTGTKQNQNAHKIYAPT